MCPIPKFLSEKRLPMQDDSEGTEDTLFTAFKSGLKAALAAKAIAHQKAVWQKVSHGGFKVMTENESWLRLSQDRHEVMAKNES